MGRRISPQDHLQRPRLQQALDLLTTTGYAYPSGHMTGVVAMSIAVGATFAVTRQSFRARIFPACGLGSAGTRRRRRSLDYRRPLHHRHRGRRFVWLPRCDRRTTCGRSHANLHELVGEIVRSRAVAEEAAAVPTKRAAVIFNPAKVTDWITFRRHVEYELKKSRLGTGSLARDHDRGSGRAMTESRPYARRSTWC